jgi:hypothetical protein
MSEKTIKMAEIIKLNVFFLKNDLIFMLHGLWNDLKIN